MLNSYAAVLANICHEYIEFGLEAFDNNKFRQICIEHQGNLLIVRPIFTSLLTPEMTKEEHQAQAHLEEELQSSQQLLLLCFICDKDCQLGMVSRQVGSLADQIAKQMQ